LRIYWKCCEVKELEEAAFQANALGFIASLPNGFSSIITDNFKLAQTPLGYGHFSKTKGREKQKVTIIIIITDKSGHP
jgi:ABC-type multidrug transport system fused ATPase/permease subunit